MLSIGAHGDGGAVTKDEFPRTCYLTHRPAILVEPLVADGLWRDLRGRVALVQAC